MRETSPYSGDNYRPGDHYMVCDECGFTYRKSEIRKRWDGAMVCRKDWEPQHPQDKLRGKADNMAVRNARLETYQAVLNDGCTLATGWTVGAGWTLADEYRHSTGTAALDRAVTGLRSGTEYLLQIRTDGRHTGSVVVSLLTSTTESRDLTITVDGQSDITFTATGTTDTLRFTPSNDFDGAIQWVAIYPNNSTISQGDL